MLKVFWRTIAVVLWTILIAIVGLEAGMAVMMWVDGTDEKAHEYSKHIFTKK